MQKAFAGMYDRAMHFKGLSSLMTFVTVCQE